jgi:predicted transcriptional regulator
MANNAILMSIRPRYAAKIFDGSKTVELRRIRPKMLAPDDLILVYVSAPVKSLVGVFKVALIMEKTIEPLWKSVRNYAGVTRTEFLSYYEGVETGVAIFIKERWLLPKPIHISQLQKHEKSFVPPQSFRYTSIQQINSL